MENKTSVKWQEFQVLDYCSDKIRGILYSY
jgi:hypothetical protein